jgi:hypothetical protein
MVFRALIAGGRHFANYAILRATLDVLLANHLPDVELLTTGGRGVPMLAASYATARGWSWWHGCPTLPGSRSMRRNTFLVNEADAALVVWDGRDPTVRRVLELVERKGIPLHVIGAPPKKSARRVRITELPPRRGLPD